MIEYLSVAQAAEKWGIKPWRVRKGCETGQIPDVAKMGEEWLIPSANEKPTLYFPRNNKETKNKTQHGSEYKDQIYNITKEGFPEFNCQIYEINNVRYNVHSCYKSDSSRLMPAAILNAFLKQIIYGDKNENGISISIEDKRKIVDNYNDILKSKVDFNKVRDYYLEKFIEIGFSQLETDELMDKIDEHILKMRDALGL